MTGERSYGEEEKRPADSYPSDKKVAVPTSKGGGGAADDDDSKPKLSWLAAITGVQTLKELIVIIAASAVLIKLLDILAGFFSSISSLFNEAVKLHSAPIAVVRTFDWHLVLLGVSLVIGISAIVIVLLKSVFNGHGSSSGKTEDGLKLADLPLGQLFSSAADFWREMTKK